MSIRIGIGLDNFASAGIDANAQAIFNRIIADGGVSNLSRLNFFVKGLKAIYGDLANVPVCYDAHWIGYKLGSGTGATAGQAAAKLYSLTVAGDAVQSTAASQPLLLAHNGASTDNYWYGSGVISNYVTTPNATANQIAGDIEIIVNCSKDNWTANNFAGLISKDVGTRGYIFFIDATNNLNLLVNVGGTLVGQNSSVALSGANQSNKWLRATRSSSTGNINYYTSLDPISTNPQSVTWTQLGTANRTSTAGAIVSGTARVDIGAFGTGDYVIQGKIYRATISNSIGGAPVVDFNPAQYNASTSQTAWTSSTGEVWTINTGTATSGYKGVLVDRTIVQGDGVDDRLSNATNVISFTSQFGIYCSVKSNLTATATYPSIFGQGNDGGLGTTKNVMFITKKFNETSQRLATDIFSPSGVDTPVDTTLNLLSFASLRVNSWSTHKTDGLTKINKNSNSLTVTSYGATNPISPLNTDGFSIFGLPNGTSSLLNGIINTFILSNSYDNDSKNTATYNLIRSLNNNAF